MGKQQKYRYMKELLICIGLLLATIAVYWQIYSYEFMIYDDIDYVVENPHVRSGLRLENIKWAFTTTFHRHWHPLTWLSHIVDAHIFGLNPGAHHLASLAFHCVNTLLLFLIFRAMTGHIWQSAVVAVLFALHPLHVETVAWIADRKDLLSALFWICAIGAYLWYVNRPGIRRYSLVVCCFVFGLMSKSVVVTLPAVLLLLDYWPLNRLSLWHGSPQPLPVNSSAHTHLFIRSSGLLRILAEKLVLLLFLAGPAVITILSRKGQLSSGDAETKAAIFTLGHVIEGVAAYGLYIAKMFVPVRLTNPYPAMYAGELSFWQIGGACGVLIIVTAGVIYWRKRYPFLLVGWGWFGFTLLPMTRLAGLGPRIPADRYTYLPLIGLFIMIAWGIPALLQASPYRRIVLTSAAVAVLVLMMTLSWRQLQHWKNGVTLFQHTLALYPDDHTSRNRLGVDLMRQNRNAEAAEQFAWILQRMPDNVEALHNLALIQYEQGQFDEAEQLFLEALRLYPSHSMSHKMLGELYLRQGEYAQAQRHFEETLRLQPELAEVKNMLGESFYKQGALDDAIRCYQEAIALQPDFADAYANLGRVLKTAGDLEGALQQFVQALEIAPSHAETHNELGILLAQDGEFDEAIKHYRIALTQKPEYAEAHYNLAIALLRKNNPQEALLHLNNAVHFKPDFAEAHNNLGILLAQKGELDNAVKHFKQAVQLRPQYEDALRNLARAQQLLQEASP